MIHTGIGCAATGCITLNSYIYCEIQFKLSGPHVQSVGGIALQSAECCIAQKYRTTSANKELRSGLKQFGFEKPDFKLQPSMSSGIKP